MTTVNKDLINNWGKEAAQALIFDGVDLNSTITKIASDNSLNPDQIARVVEAANIATHLSVAKSDNNYPEFEVADTKKIASAAESNIIDITISDYDLPPKQASVMTKEASAGYSEPKEEGPLKFTYAQKQSMKEAEKFYDEKLAELEINVFKEIGQMKHYVKQACLNPDSPDGALTLMKAAAFASTHEVWRPATKNLFDYIEDSLPQTLVKKASVEPTMPSSAILNPESEFIQKLGSYLEAVKEYKIAKENKLDALTKFAKFKLFSRVGDMAANLFGNKAAKGGSSQFLPAIYDGGKVSTNVTSIGKATSGAPLSGSTPDSLGSSWKMKALKGAGALAAPTLIVGTAAKKGYNMGRESALQKMAPLRSSNVSMNRRF